MATTDKPQVFSGDRLLYRSQFDLILGEYGIKGERGKIISAPEKFDWRVFENTPIRISPSQTTYTVLAHHPHKVKEPNYQRFWFALKAAVPSSDPLVLATDEKFEAFFS